MPTGSELVVDFLGQPAAYPEGTSQVTRCETHISWVFLTDHHAYKLKKPVTFDFLDYGTLDRRRQACDDELRLNRRLAPDVYLGVLPVGRDTAGQMALGSVDEVLDWVVQMRRLPAEQTLESRLRRGQRSDAEVLPIVRRLVRFYREQPPVALAADSYLQALRDHVRANRQSLLDAAPAADGPRIHRVHTSQLVWLLREAELIRQRVRQRRIVDGHGDLRPEHIYLLPEPVIIDCIEFNAEFRRLDALDELCFLAMECEHLNAAGLAEQLLDDYARESGDPAPRPLRDFYRSYRGCVRAKVTMLRAQQLAGAAAARKQRLGDAYLRQAERDADRLGPPLLLTVRGLVGTGKSTLARELADDMGAVLLQTDAIRRELFVEGSRPAAYNTARYSASNRVRVYEEMLRRADAWLRQRVSVILDGTFLTRETRHRVLELAQRHQATPAVLRCDCPPTVAEARIRHRQQVGADLSEARPEFYAWQHAEEEPPRDDEPTITVDTTQPLVQQKEQLVEFLRNAWPAAGVG